MPEPDRLSPDRLGAPLPRPRPGARGAARCACRAMTAVLASVIRGRPVVLAVVGLEDPRGAVGSAARRRPRRAHRRRRSAAARLALRRRAQERGRDRCSGRGPRPLNVDPEGGVVRRMPADRRGRRACSCPPLRSRCSAWPRGSPPWWCAPACTASRLWSSATSRFPTQPHGDVWIHYARSAPARFVSAAEVLVGHGGPVRQFEGKLVLVGATALAIGDFRPRPWATGCRRRDPRPAHRGPLRRRPALAPVRGPSGSKRRCSPRRAGSLILALPALPAAVSTAIAIALAAVTIALSLGFYFGGADPVRRGVPTIGMGALFTTMLGATLGEAQGQRRALRRQVARQREVAARLAGELEAARRIQMGSLPTPAAALPRGDALRSATPFSPRRARSAATSTTSSSSTSTGSSSSSATYRARACRAACSWR